MRARSAKNGILPGINSLRKFLPFALLLLIAAAVFFKSDNDGRAPKEPEAPIKTVLIASPEPIDTLLATIQKRTQKKESNLSYTRPREPFVPPGHISFLTGPNKGAPLDIALRTVREKLVERDYLPADYADPVVRDHYRTKHNGVIHIYLRQQIDGIEVYNGDIAINIARDGSVINLHNGFVKNLAAEINATEPQISPKAAAAAASKALRISNHEPADKVTLMYLPQPENETRLVWNLQIDVQDHPDYWDVNIDAVDGRMLSKANWTAAASYNVYAMPLENPDDGARTVETDPHDTTASPFGWHDTDGIAGAEFTGTRGNNADALHNPTVTRTDGGSMLNFDFPIDLAMEPDTHVNASVTNAFYWTNLCHDVLYHFGFDEVAGNFQKNNYGNGGMADDEVSVQVHEDDPARQNNAFFTTLPDGSRGFMQLAMQDETTPERDFSLNNTTLIHEYGHGLSNRLTGGPASASSLASVQARGMGEGWSDFLALVFTAKASDTAMTPYHYGHYMKGNSASVGPGFRTHPYTNDPALNDLTIGDANGDTQEHYIGTRWCTILWDMYWELVGLYGFDPDLKNGTGGNNLALQLVIDGMKLQPSNPTYMEARDAIILADQTNNNSANQFILWSVFASRGLGADASGSGDVTESFDLPPLLAVSPTLTVVSSGLHGGPFSPVSYDLTITNVSGITAAWTANTSTPWLTITNTAGTLTNMQSEIVTASINSSAQTLTPGVYEGVVSYTLDSGFSGQSRIRLVVGETAQMPFFEDWNTDIISPYWSFGGSGNYTNDIITTFLEERRLRTTSTSGLSHNEIVLSIDLRHYTGVTLDYQAFILAQESSYTNAPSIPHLSGAAVFYDGVSISEDGVNWYYVGNYSVPQTVDLDAAIAMHGLSYNSAFKIMFHRSGFSGTNRGIDYDNISVTGTLSPGLFLTLPETLNENGGTIAGQAVVRVDPPPAADLPVTITSSALDVITIDAPNPVIVPAGQNLVSFDFTVVDNVLLDGAKSAAITVAGTGYESDSSVISVEDDETAQLALLIPATAAETDGVLSGGGTVSLSTAPSVEFLIALESSDPLVQVPATVAIPAGQTSASFDITLVDDAAVQGQRDVSISCSFPNLTGTTQAIRVSDDDAPALSITAIASIVEGQDLSGSTVSIPAALGSDLMVTLTVKDPNIVPSPGTVTIFAGQLNAAFNLIAFGDDFVEATQTVELCASATGYNDGSASTDVIDANTVTSLTIANIPTPQTVGAGIPVTVTARNVLGDLVTTSDGTFTLSATGDGGNQVVSPSSGVFVFGSWSGNVSLNSVDTNVQLTSTMGSASGTSNPFDVNPVPAIQLSLPASVAENGGNVTGTVTVNFAPTFNLFVDLVSSDPSLIGFSLPSVVILPNQTSATFQMQRPGNSTPELTRTVTISASADFGGYLPDSADVDILDDDPHHFVFDPIPTLQLRSQPFSVTVRAEDSNNELLTAHSGLLLLTGTADDGSASVLPSFAQSFANGEWTGDVTVTQTDSNVRIVANGSDSSNPFHVVNSGALTLTLPNSISEGAGTQSNAATLSAIIAPPVDLTVSLTSSDTGELTVPASATIPAGQTSVSFDITAVDDALTDGDVSVTVSVTDTGLQFGDTSDTIIVIDDEALDPPVLNAEPQFTGGLENTISWSTVSGANEYEVQSSTSSQFNAFETSGWITATTHNFVGLSDGTRYYYRARARDASLNESDWSALVFSWQDATPPTLTITNPTTALVTVASTAAISGTSNGFVTVDGSPALGFFGSWDGSASLAPGINTVTVVASDTASPPNTVTETVTITRVTDADGDGLPGDWETANMLDDSDDSGDNGALGDPDADGVVNLLEFVFNLNPQSPDSDGLPTLSTEVNPATTKEHVIFEYRRRIDIQGYRYQIFKSTDLINWTSPFNGFTELRAILNPDGVTETVHVRVSPAIMDENRQFLELRVSKSLGGFF